MRAERFILEQEVDGFVKNGWVTCLNAFRKVSSFTMTNQSNRANAAAGAGERAP
jgi:hypothetical protein